MPGLLPHIDPDISSMLKRVYGAHSALLAGLDKWHHVPSTRDQLEDALSAVAPQMVTIWSGEQRDGGLSLRAMEGPLGCSVSIEGPMVHVDDVLF